MNSTALLQQMMKDFFCVNPRTIDPVISFDPDETETDPNSPTTEEN